MRIKNILPAAWIAIVLSVALAGIIGTIDSVFTIFTGHPSRADTTPPSINSRIESVPSCGYTTIKPSVTVKEPDTGWLEWNTGLKLVQMYVGADKVGEWPIFTKDKESFELKSPKYNRNSIATVGPVIIVAEDHAGNIEVKRIDGVYHPPFCYDHELSKSNNCKCGNLPYAYTMNNVAVESGNDEVEADSADEKARKN